LPTQGASQKGGQNRGVRQLPDPNAEAPSERILAVPSIMLATADTIVRSCKVGREKFNRAPRNGMHPSNSRIRALGLGVSPRLAGSSASADLVRFHTIPRRRLACYRQSASELPPRSPQTPISVDSTATDASSQARPSNRDFWRVIAVFRGAREYNTLVALRGWPSLLPERCETKGLSSWREPMARA